MARSSNDINININGKYGAKSAFKEAEKDLDGLDKKAKETDASLKKTSRGVGTFGAGSSKASNNLKSLGGALGVFNKNLGTSVSKVGGAQGAIAGMAATMGGPLVAAAVAAGAAIATFAALSYQKAVQSQAEWAKFKGIVEAQGQSFENSKKIVKDFAFTAGRSVSEVRTAFSQLTAAGINPSGQAMRGVSEMAIGLRTDMVSAATAYTRIVKGGAGAGRTLAKLGITMEEISTGGKVDTAKLNAILEQKFGAAADNFANTSQAAGARLSMAIDGLMVAFGNVLLGPATDIQNALAYAVKGLTEFGGWLFNLFGGAQAWSGAMEYLQPALAELGAAIGEVIGVVVSVMGTGSGSSFGSLKPILTALGASLATSIRTIAMVVRVLAWIMGAARNTGQALINFGQALYNLPGTLRGYLVSAGQRIYSAVSNFGSWVWSAIQNALPKIQWPSPGTIYNMIKNALGFGGPPSGLYSSTVSRWKANLTAEGLAAQRAALVTTYQSSPAAQSAASTATSNMGIFGSLSSFFGPPMDKLNVNYQYYKGSRQNPWSGDNCLTGNCVDMTRGVLQYAAASGAKRLGIAAGSWDGSPHVWAVVDGKAYDPARKALDGTWNPPAAGPGRNGGNTYVFQGPVYDWNAFKKQVQRANDNIVGGVY